MEVKRGNSCYYIGESENNYKGILEFEDLGDVIDAKHTIVKPEFGGQGLAGELVKKLIEDAKAEGKKIKPTCSYVQKKLEGPEYDDLRA